MRYMLLFLFSFSALAADQYHTFQVNNVANPDAAISFLQGVSCPDLSIRGWDYSGTTLKIHLGGPRLTTCLSNYRTAISNQFGSPAVVDSSVTPSQSKVTTGADLRDAQKAEVIVGP